MSRAQQTGRAIWTAGPGLGWVALFLVAPLGAVLAMSFLRRGSYGEVIWEFTVGNYTRFAGFGLFGFDPLYPRIILRSLGMGLTATLLCAVVALPLCLFLVRLPGRARYFGLMLIVIPFWTNLLIRTYAWQILLSADGTLAWVAVELGFIKAGQALYPGLGAVLLVMVCDFLPVMALPLYASVEKVDWSVVEAANDLGANRWGAFWHALLPQVKAGLAAGSVLVFIAAAGQFVIPDLMGGARIALLGNAIQQQFGSSRDWPFGSAIACVAMIIVLAGIWIFGRAAGPEGKKALL
jgi:spermidine/putrescine transport system permease protein